MSASRERSSLRGRFAILALAVPLLGCGSLPESGPSTSTIRDRLGDADAGYDIVEITRQAVDILATPKVDGLAERFRDGRPPAELRVGIGDTLEVTVFEAAPGGLFNAVQTASIHSSSSARAVQIPAQAVDQTGAIWVPYCGRIQAAGRTPAEIAATVEAGLRGNAIEPQVIVSIVQNQSNLVTIAGEVGQGMRFPLRLTGDRVLDALAMAGGPRGPSHETFVRLMRGTSSASMLLQRIVADPRENIYLRPGDDLFVYRSPLTFTVFGATGRNGQIPFEASQLSLAEALAKAGGLLDHRADAKGVWVFRYEEPEFYGLLRPSREPPPAKDGRVPVVFHIDLTSANAYSLAQAFPIRDKDLVFVSNAPIVDFQKVLGIIGSAFGASGAQSAINATR